MPLLCYLLKTIYALDTLLPMPTLDFSAFLAASCDGDISDLVLGVFADTFLVGLQYSLLPPAPQALPLLVSCHFSFSQRFRSAPFSDLVTLPDDLRHLAIACEALAEGNTSYDAFTFL
jgi:hypothetical protein